LQTVCQQVAMAARLAIFAVVVDRMVVAARQLEGGEQRLGLGARVDVVALPDPHILEPMRRPEAGRAGVEGGFRHSLSPCFFIAGSLTAVRARLPENRALYRLAARARCGCASRPAGRYLSRRARRRPSRRRTASA